MKKILIFILVASFFVLISSVYAQSVNIKICDDQKCYAYEENSLNVFDKNDSLALKIEIINDNKKIMCWDSINYGFYIVPLKSPDRKIWVSKSLSSSNQNEKVCFSKEKEESTILYVPLQEYNKLLITDRIGDWKISDFKVTFGNLQYYSSNILKDSQSELTNLNNVFDSQELTFYVGTDNPTKGINFGENIKLILKLLSAASFIIFGYAIYELIKSNRKSEKKKWFIWLVISLALLIISGKLGFF